jgi:toxin ParE1/3/4
MSRELSWAGLAELDLDTIEDFIAQDKPRAAIDTVDTIEATVQLLKRFPDMGKKGRVKGTRELVIPRLPYIVVYRLRGDMVEIIRVLHGAQPWP